MEDRSRRDPCGSAERRAEDVACETMMTYDKATYDKAELLAMAEAADAPLDVLQALRELAPQARFTYLAELWASRPEVGRQ